MRKGSVSGFRKVRTLVLGFGVIGGIKGKVRCASWGLEGLQTASLERIDCFRVVS